jgi:hypothetical protein
MITITVLYPLLLRRLLKQLPMEIGCLPLIVRPLSAYPQSNQAPRQAKG